MACAFSSDPANADNCTAIEDYVATAHGQQLLALQPAVPLFEGKTLPSGSSCFRDNDDYGGRCTITGGTTTCEATGTDLTTPFDPESIGRWIEENWPVVLGLTLGAVLLGFGLKYTYQRKKPQIKGAMSRASDTIRRRTGMPKRGSQLRDPMASMAAGRPLTSGQREKLKLKLRKGEALKRLQKFFPTCQDKALIENVMSRSRNEEESVKKMLKLGYPFAIPDKVPLLNPKRLSTT